MDAEDFAAAEEGQLPIGKPTDEWVSATSRRASSRPTSSSTRRSSSQSTGHQPLETRSAMAYWQNGKLLPARLDAEHGADRRARSRAGSGSSPNDVVLVSEYTGGGFGSKIPGAISMAIPALLSKKANAPVMMRITREEEHYIGRARPGLHSRVKVGFRKDGKITAIDGLAIVRTTAPTTSRATSGSAGQHHLAVLSARGDAVARH